MHALIMPEPGKVLDQEMDIPIHDSSSALVKMVSCGICGSDVTAFKGTNPTVRYPIMGIGHEGIGIIEDIGTNDRGLKAGDRVALEPYIPCGKCHQCQVGHYNNCEHLQVAGVHTSGMMMDYVCHPISLIHKLPDRIDDIDAALTEPFTIGLHGVERGRISEGEVCVVMGAGPIGVLTAFGVMSRGATPIIVDVIQARLDDAISIGIPYAFNNTSNGLPDFIRSVNNGNLADAFIDCTGSSDSLVSFHEYVRHGARCVFLGWPKDIVRINTIRCMQKELDILTSRNSRDKFPEAIRLIEQGFLPARKMITKVIERDEFEGTLADMISNPQNYMKVVVRI